MLCCGVYPRGYSKILGLRMEERVANFHWYVTREQLGLFPEALKLRFASVSFSCYSKKPPL